MEKGLFCNAVYRLNHYSCCPPLLAFPQAAAEKAKDAKDAATAARQKAENDRAKAVAEREAAEKARAEAEAAREKAETQVPAYLSTPNLPPFLHFISCVMRLRLRSSWVAGYLNLRYDKTSLCVL